MTDKRTLVEEVGGSNKPNGRREDLPLSSLICTYYPTTDNILWDAGVKIGMNKAAPGFRVATGLASLFKP